jgi:hypothetical protein
MACTTPLGSNGSNLLSRQEPFEKKSNFPCVRGQTCCIDTAMSLNHHFLDGPGLARQTQGRTCGASSRLLQHSVDVLNVTGDERYKIEDPVVLRIHQDLSGTLKYLVPSPFDTPRTLSEAVEE